MFLGRLTAESLPSARLRKTDIMVLQPSEDLFEDTRMSFGEHLEELRRVLMRAIVGLTVGFGIAMIFASQIIQFLQQPLEDAIRDFNKKQAETSITARIGYVPPEIRPRLDKDQLIPRKLKLEPKELLGVLDEHFPEMNLAEAGREHRFTPSQLPMDQVADLAERLANPFEGERARQFVAVVDRPSPRSPPFPSWPNRVRSSGPIAPICSRCSTI